jgi:hypothetical protein
MNLKKFLCRIALIQLVIFAVPKAGWCGEEEADLNWQQASRFVDTLPFKKSIIDSIKKSYQVVFPASPLRKVPDQSFSLGEILVYDVGWGPFKAGYVVLTAEPDGATRTIRLDGKALSRGFVSTFYRMRDNVVSTVDADGLYPLFFEQHLREGKHFKADTWILFDHLRDSVHIKDGQLKNLGAARFTNDYLSIFYYLRSLTFGPGDTFSLPICVDKRLRSINFWCKSRDTIEMEGKAIPCLRIVPRISDDKGTFNKKNGFEVWLSDDAVKMPVKIKSKISLGSINAKLVYAFRPLRPSLPAVVRRRDSAHGADTAPLRSVRKHDSSRSAETLKAPDSPKRSGTAQCYSTVSAHDTAHALIGTFDSVSP